MKAFIKVINGQYVDGCNMYLLSQEYPEVDFPPDFLREDNPDLPQYNVATCEVLPKPQHDSANHDCQWQKPELIDGQWVQDWQLIEKLAEEKRQSKYDPRSFFIALDNNSRYQTWILLIPSPKYTNFSVAAQRAADSGDWSHVQVMYDRLKSSKPHLHAAEWQAIADNYGIPITF